MMKARMTWLALPAIGAWGLATAAVSQTAGTLPGGISTDRPRIPGQDLAGMHVYLRAGLKTHGEGQHDYPQFLADWSKLLTAKGAVVDGSFHAPSAAELAQTDVIVMYKGDAGFMDAAEQAALDGFVKRGGGLVLLHDAMCGPDPATFAGYVGGAKKHGEVNYTLETQVPLTVVDKASPIMTGMTNLSLPDEAFYKMTWAEKPGIHVLATTVISDTPAARRGGGVGQTVPQVWTYEHQVAGGTKPARSFVWMQGHTYANLAQPQVQAMLLRGIAWAAHRPVDELVSYKPAPRPERPATPATGGAQ